MNKLIQSLSAIGVSATLVTPNLNAEATTNSEPQLRGVNDIIIEKGEDYNLLQGISAYDKEDGDLTHKIKIDGNVDTTKSGTYEVKYKVTDSDGAQKFQLEILKSNNILYLVEIKFSTFLFSEYLQFIYLKMHYLLQFHKFDLFHKMYTQF